MSEGKFSSLASPASFQQKMQRGRLVAKLGATSLVKPPLFFFKRKEIDWFIRADESVQFSLSQAFIPFLISQNTLCLKLKLLTTASSLLSISSAKDSYVFNCHPLFCLIAKSDQKIIDQDLVASFQANLQRADLVAKQSETSQAKRQKRSPFRGVKPNTQTNWLGPTSHSPDRFPIQNFSSLKGQGHQKTPEGVCFDLAQ